MSTSTSPEPRIAAMNGQNHAFVEAKAHDTLDVVSALWRYRWAVILPAVVGAVVGFLIYLRMSEVYRSTTRLIVESDRAPVMDALTGEVLGGVPGIEIVESQLRSDRVIATAYDNLAGFHNRFPDGLKEFKKVAISDESLVIEPEVTDLKTAQSLVILLHFDSDDPEFSTYAVKAFSDALRQFYNEKHKDSREELRIYISDATENLHPQMRALEETYRNFRMQTDLAWDPERKAINPHRERQLFLVQRRSELSEQLRKVATEQAAVSSVIKTASNPEVALLVVSQLLEKRFLIPSDNDLRVSIGQDDEQLAMVRVDENLIPLLVERSQLASQFGPEHRTVKDLDLRIDKMRTELSRVAGDQAKRIAELLDGSDRKKNEAMEATSAILSGLSAQVAILGSQIAELDDQIKDERAAATALAEDELEHEALLREMDQQRALMDQLDEQMARVSLTDDESGTQVVELTAASEAYIVSPNLLKNLAIGTFLGLVLGGGLAFLLEKNANTFRDPDEIAQDLGVPVLTHVPFFKGRLKRVKKGEENPCQDLDPYLSVVHSPSSVASEAVRSLRTSVFFETTGPGGKVIQVTSPLPGDGKSTIAGNLACSIAQSGKKVLAIDCDLRRPQLSDNFALGNSLGLTHVLNGDCELDEASHETPVANLRVMPSGPVPANPADALTLPDMAELIESLRDKYDYILIDTPPLLVVTDPSITASMVDGVILALRIRRKSRPNAKESVNILRAVGARVLGVVINNSDESSASDGYRGYGYYRYGRYTTRYYRRNESSNSAATGSRDRRRSSAPVVVSGRGLAAANKAARPAEPQSPPGRRSAKSEKDA